MITLRILPNIRVITIVSSTTLFSLRQEFIVSSSSAESGSLPNAKSDSAGCLFLPLLRRHSEPLVSYVSLPFLHLL
jgi:hypothetical protein